ncbi:MAG: tyrosine-type recombinase/integrase [Solirubrobacteraceae bacterium]
MASKYTTARYGERWRAHWRDDTGRQRSKTFSTEGAALEWEKKMREERDDDLLGRNTRARDMRLSDWIAEWWDRYLTHRPLNTRESYQRAINGLIAPYIGGLPMDRIDTMRLSPWMDELTDDGWTAHQRREAKSVLSSCLGKALSRGLLPRCASENPVKGVDRPEANSSRQPIALSPYECEYLRLASLTYQYGRADDIQALRSATIISLLAYGGLRPSEAMGLKAENVAFDEHNPGVWVRDVFTVEHREFDTKTHEGSRFIGAGRFVDLPDRVMDDLRSWFDARETTERRRARGRDWVFPDENGQITRSTHRNWTSSRWKRARRRAAEMLPESGDRISAMVPYDLRHSAVSCEVRAGGRDVQWADLAAKFGHTVQTMQSAYLHVVRSLRNAPREPVADQITKARTQAGSDAAQEALLERVLGPKPELHRVVDLRRERQRRAS